MTRLSKFAYYKWDDLKKNTWPGLILFRYHKIIQNHCDIWFQKLVKKDILILNMSEKSCHFSTFIFHQELTLDTKSMRQKFIIFMGVCKIYQTAGNPWVILIPVQWSKGIATTVFKLHCFEHEILLKINKSKII